MKLLYYENLELYGSSQNRDRKYFKIYFHSTATPELYLQPVSILFDS